MPVSRTLRLAGAALVAAALVAATPATAGAQASAPPAVTHLDLTAGQQPENLVLLPDGTPVVTFALTGLVAEVRPGGRIVPVAQLPVPADGDTPVLHAKAFAAGIDRVGRTLYVALSTGTAAGTGVWRIAPGRPPARISALPAGALLNGLAVDARHGWIYLTDSVLSTVWRVPLGGGPAQPWSTSSLFAPAGFVGANGLKIHDGAVWVTNLDAGTLLRVPVRDHGAAGSPRVVAQGLGGVDDFAFTGHGDEVVIADVKDDSVLRLRPGHPATTLLGAADGLSNPTAVALRDGRLLVTSAAYFTQRDPNLLSARLPGRSRADAG